MANSFMTREINLLRQELTSLRSEVLTLSKTATSLQCGQDLELVKRELSCLNTEVERVRNLAVQYSTSEIMKPNKSVTAVTGTSSPSFSYICVQSWNYRDIMSGAPYVQHMAEEADIVVLCEHWLWPYQLHQLQLLHPEFKAFGVADKRLTETSDLNRGCGGIAILWRKSLLAIPLDVPSDRVCAIQLKHSSSSSVMTIIGAYLPSTDHQIEEFDNCLQQLEDTIIAYNHLGPVMVVGDFNSHIGSGSELGSSTNIQGQLLIQLMDRCSLYPITLSNLTKGPRYTFFRDNTKSLIDLVLLSAAHASLVEQSEILQHQQHIRPPPVKISAKWSTEWNDACPPTQKINWTKASDGRSDKRVCKEGGGHHSST